MLVESIAEMQLEEKTIINKQKRKSNFELLRIISMICIISHHYVVHGGSLFLKDGPNIGISEFLFLGGKLGVNCFILISGYFMVNSEFKFKKLLKIVLQVLFYMIVTKLIFQNFGLIKVKGVEEINVFEDYWFIKAYIGLYIISPFLNDFIKKIYKKRHFKVIVVLTILQGALPTFFENSLFTNYLTWFSYVYIIGAYIRLYMIDDNIKIRKLLMLFIGGSILILIPTIKYIITGKQDEHLLEITNNLGSTYSLAILFCAVMLFLIFKSLEIRTNTIINIISSTTFGIYLIHDNSFISKKIWGEWTKASDFYSVPMGDYLENALSSIVIIFILCCLIDLVRIYCLEKWIFKIKILDNHFNKIDNWINK